VTKRTATQIVEPLTLEVTFEDGKTAEYTTMPVDVARTEDHFNRGADELIGNLRALMFMAYSVALRRGEAYRTRRQSTDKRDAFDAWAATVASIALITFEDEDADPKGDAPAQPLEAGNGSLSA
jgi:hypothetical protein